MKNKHSNKMKLIDKIEGIRKKNNKNWMDILRIAFRYAPEKTSSVLAQIYQQDKKINQLAKKLKIRN